MAGVGLDDLMCEASDDGVCLGTGRPKRTGRAETKTLPHLAFRFRRRTSRHDGDVAPPKIVALEISQGRSRQFRCGHQCRRGEEEWGGRRDLNPRQPDPQSGALTRLSYDHQDRLTS